MVKRVTPYLCLRESIRAVTQDNRYFYELQRDRVSMIVCALEERWGKRKGADLPPCSRFVKP